MRLINGLHMSNSEGSWGIVAVHCLLHLAAGADIDKFASTKEPFWLS